MKKGPKRGPLSWRNPTGMNLLIKLAFRFRNRLQGETCYKVDGWPLPWRRPSVRHSAGEQQVLWLYSTSRIFHGVRVSWCSDLLSINAQGLSWYDKAIHVLAYWAARLDCQRTTLSLWVVSNRGMSGPQPRNDRPKPYHALVCPRN